MQMSSRNRSRCKHASIPHAQHIQRCPMRTAQSSPAVVDMGVLPIYCPTHSDLMCMLANCHLSLGRESSSEHSCSMLSSCSTHQLQSNPCMHVCNQVSSAPKQQRAPERVDQQKHSHKSNPMMYSRHHCTMIRSASLRSSNSVDCT